MQRLRMSRQESVRELDDVHEVSADRLQGQVTVLLNDRRAHEASVRARIEQAGYGVKVKR